MTDLAPGAVIAGHRLESVLGRGGMGVVFRATQLALDRQVAVKIIAAELLAVPGARERFLRESRVAAAIEHPNVIPIYSAGSEDGVDFIVMRYVRGSDLEERVRASGPFEPAAAADVVAQLGAALDSAHAAGLVHRDVKPANVLLGPDDHVYLTDFGVARHLLSDAGLTATGRWVGTLDYVAPEQIRDEPVDGRADVYALGCILHLLLTGEVPYPRASDEARLWAHVHTAPPAPSSVASVPRAFDRVVAEALAKDPASRFQTAGELGRAAVEAAAGAAPVSPTAGRMRRTTAVTESPFARSGSASPPAASSPATSSPAASSPAPTSPAAPSPAASSRAASSPGASSPAPSSPGASSPAPSSPARKHVARGATILAVALAGALAAALAGALVRGDDGENGSSTSTPTRPVAPAAKSEPPRVVKTLRTGDRPGAVVLSGRSAWVAGTERRTLVRADTRTNRVVRGPAVGGGGTDFAVDDDGGLLVALTRANRVARVSAGGRVLPPFPTPGWATAVALGAEGLWVGVDSVGSARLQQLDAEDGSTLADVPMPGKVLDVVTGFESVWAVVAEPPSLAQVDPETRQVGEEIPVGASPLRVDTGGGYLWVTSFDDNAVVRVDPRTKETVTIAVPSKPYGIDVHGRWAWVVSYGAHALVRINTETARVEGAPLPVGLNPVGVTAGDDTVWVTGRADDSLTRVAYRD